MGLRIAAAESAAYSWALKALKLASRAKQRTRLHQCWQLHIVFIVKYWPAQILSNS